MKIRDQHKGLRPTNSSKLERWLGTEEVDRLSAAVRGWYGPPIALGGVPGRVYACGDGDFRGPILTGQFSNQLDYTIGRMKRVLTPKGVAMVARRFAQEQEAMCGAGFASLDAVRAALSIGQYRDFQFSKTTGTRVSNACMSLWAVGTQPAAGAIGAAAPGGTAHTDATTGGIPFTNPGGSFTMHYIWTKFGTSQALATELIYDRLFAVAVNMNSSATQAVTGVPTRYQSTTGGAADSAEGNFVFPETISTLAATAHNWTVCQYTDQAGATGQSFPSIAGNSANLINRIDLPTLAWFMPLASGDLGVKALTQMQLSAAVATGTADMVQGHVIALVSNPLANCVALDDGLYSAMSFERIFDDACLAFMDLFCNNTSTQVINGFVKAAFA